MNRAASLLFCLAVGCTPSMSTTAPPADPPKPSASKPVISSSKLDTSGKTPEAPRGKVAEIGGMRIEIKAVCTEALATFDLEITNRSEGKRYTFGNWGAIVVVDQYDNRLDVSDVAIPGGAEYIDPGQTLRISVATVPPTAQAKSFNIDIPGSVLGIKDKTFRFHVDRSK